MPRERIQHGKQYAHIPQESPDETLPGAPIEQVVEYSPGKEYPEGTTITEDQSLDISWGGNDTGYVQLSISAPIDFWQRFVEPDAWAPDTGDRAVYTGTLQRHEINNLIRTLRRARNAAFGVDE